MAKLATMERDEQCRESVLTLLKLLRDRVRHEKKSNFAQLLPMYEQLLNHRERIPDPEHHIVRELGHIRLMLKEYTDMFRMVERLDQVVDRCFDISQHAETAHYDAFPIEGAMRLLIALAGGHDGQTFRLEDPMRIAKEENLMQEKQRLGEQIRMSNVQLVLESSGLFNAESIPLHEEKVLTKHKFGLFDGNLLDRQSSLWIPDAFPTELGVGFLGSMPFGSQFVPASTTP
uniref:Uncharacterized protein n=1 Tax=Globisporangium ultimum (strain ATCC 200006 / CBS 805.95 / DAOM BR144) TaxID=431595 RepID=K3W9T6_GLOUD